MIVTFYTLASTRDVNDIKYVGKTKQTIKRRLQGHICKAHETKKSNYFGTYNYNWINKEESDGYTIVIEEIESIDIPDDSDEWKDYEIYWIAQFKVWGFKLTNIGKGGEDNYLPHPTEQTIEKRAEKIRGIPRDEETRRKISEGLTGIVRSNETKEKVRKSIIALQGRPVKQYTLDGIFIREWECGATAARELGLDKANLNACCKKKKKTCGGFRWKYSDDQEEIIDKSKFIVWCDSNNQQLGIFRYLAEASRESGVSETTIRVSIAENKITCNYRFYRYSDFCTLK